MGRMIDVAKANEKKGSMSVEDVSKWKIISKTYTRDGIYLKTDDGVFLIKIKDYEEIFEGK